MTTASGLHAARLRAGARPPRRAVGRSRTRRWGGIVLVLVAPARRLGGGQVAGRRPVAAARHGRRDPGRLRARAAASSGGSPTTCRCRTSGTSAGRSSSRPSGAARRSAASWPARRRSRSARRSPGSRSAPCSGSGSASCSSIRGSPSGRSSRTSSRRRPCRSWPSRRSSSSRSRPTGCRSWRSPTYLTFFPVTIAVAARPARVRSARARAVPLVRRDSPPGALAAAAADVGAVPVLRLPRGGRRVGHRRDHRGADRGRRVGPRQRDHQLQPVLHLRRPSGCGRRS